MAKITVEYHVQLQSKCANGKITYSEMVELLNEKASEGTFSNTEVNELIKEVVSRVSASCQKFIEEQTHIRDKIHLVKIENVELHPNENAKPISFYVFESLKEIGITNHPLDAPTQ